MKGFSSRRGKQSFFNVDLLLLFFSCVPTWCTDAHKNRRRFLKLVRAGATICPWNVGAHSQKCTLDITNKWYYDVLVISHRAKSTTRKHPQRALLFFFFLSLTPTPTCQQNTFKRTYKQSVSFFFQVQRQHAKVAKQN